MFELVHELVKSGRTVALVVIFWSSLLPVSYRISLLTTLSYDDMI